MTPDPSPASPFARACGAAAGLLQAVLGVAYPALCLGCDRRLASPPEGTGSLPLCPSCLRALPRAAPEDVAARLGRLPDDVTPLGAGWALWAYDAGGAVRRLQHALKYGNRPALGVALGRLMGEGLRRSGAPGVDGVVPVPLSRARVLERGYNQSLQLALGVADGLAAPVADALVRARPTRSQTALSRERRWTNVAGAFALRPDAPPLAGRRLLLVDDVLTTGATLAAAAEPLVEAGAAVDVATFAMAAV